MLTPLFGANRRRHSARKLSSVAYLPPQMRELLGQRAVSLKPGCAVKASELGTKRRFLSLPTNKLFVNARRVARKASFPHKQPTYGVRSSILRRALRRRRRERAYIDLRQSVRQRRLPKEKAVSIRKLRRRRNPLRRSAARRGRYNRLSTRRRSTSGSR